MRNYRQEKCKENRNNLRYLISNPFSEPLSLTIDKLVKGRVFVKNKRINITENETKIYYELVVARKSGFITVSISKDHLIVVKVSYNKTKGFISIPGTTKVQRAIDNVLIPRILDLKEMQEIDLITKPFQGDPNPQCMNFLDDPIFLGIS